jgi:hypothetical protein
MEKGERRGRRKGIEGEKEGGWGREREANEKERDRRESNEGIVRNELDEEK